MLARLPARGLGCGIWFADGDQAQGQRGTAFAADPYVPVDPISRPRQFGVRVDRLALIIQPTRIAPAGPHHNITTRVQHRCDAIGLQVDTIADTNFSRHDGDPVQLLAAVLVGQLEVSETLCGQIEGGVDAP